MGSFATVVGAAAAVGSAVAAAAAADPLAPAYHLTNPAGPLGELAGFVAQGAPHNLTFHAFFARASQPAWAHLTSPDLVTWTAATDAAPPTGAVGGSVFSVTPNVTPGVNASIAAVALGTPAVPGGAVTAAVASDATLGTFVPIVDVAHCGGKGVICPSEQPSNAPLGAAAAVQDAAATGGAGAVVALVVSNASDLVLFSSPDLVSWTAGAAPALADIPGGVSAAELFTLQEAEATGKAIIFWSGAGADRAAAWALGGWDAGALAFTETSRRAGDFGSFAGGKTTVDAQGERVLVGEIAATAGGSVSLSLPRQVYLREDGSVGMRAHPAVWGLHGARASLPVSNLSLVAGAAYNLSELVAAAPTQSHLRAQVGFRVADAKGAASLDLLGGHASGGLTVGITFNGTVVPDTCEASPISNNSDTTGSYAGPGTAVALNNSQFGLPLAEACRHLCCNTGGCAFWTATDPQPGSADHLCWMKKSDGALVPNGCSHYSSGHCWSGAVGPTNTGNHFDLTVNGVALAQQLDADHVTSAAGANSSIAWVALDVFVDHGVVEVFFNDGEASRAVVFPTATTSTAAALRAGVDGSASSDDDAATVAFFSATAWVMDSV